MPLDPNEIVKLSPLAVELGEDFRKALDVAGPGGKVVTRAERNALIRKGLVFVGTLILEALD